MDTRLTSRAAARAFVAVLVAVGGAAAQTTAGPEPRPISWTTPASANPGWSGDALLQPSQAPTATPPTFAPRKARKWAIEVHGGRFRDLLSGGSTKESRLVAFPSGTPFTTAGGRPSRTVSSWLYGDGPVLFDQVRASFAATYGVSMPGITPLDAVLRTSGITRSVGNTIGGRFSRDITSWLGLELAYDQGPSRSALSDTVTNGVEASRASYTAAFQALLTTIPHNGGAVTATTTITGGAGSTTQQIATASLVLTPIRVSKFRLHLVAGGGAVKNAVTSAEVQLQGRYRFNVLGLYPFNESETVTIRYSEKAEGATAVAGGGFSLDLVGPLGIRADARVLATKSTATTTVSSSNSRAAAAAADQLTFPSLTTPSVQFTTVAGIRSTLSGDAVTGLETYSRSGYELRPQVSIGLVLRF